MSNAVHIIDKVCSCENCLKIDCLWGDPILDLWEMNFVYSLAEWGWRRDYMLRQIQILTQIFNKVSAIRIEKKNDQLSKEARSAKKTERSRSHL